MKARYPRQDPGHPGWEGTHRYRHQTPKITHPFFELFFPSLVVFDPSPQYPHRRHDCHSLGHNPRLILFPSSRSILTHTTLIRPLRGHSARSIHFASVVYSHHRHSDRSIAKEKSPCAKEKIGCSELKHTLTVPRTHDIHSLLDRRLSVDGMYENKMMCTCKCTQTHTDPWSGQRCLVFN
jgi:hypothetical protein